MAEPQIRWDILLGHVELQTRQRWEGSRLIFEGRSLRYDGDGALTETTPWEASGTLIYPDPEPSLLARFKQWLAPKEPLR